MASNKAFTVVVALTNSAANVLNPGSVAGGVNDGSYPAYIIVRHARIVNKTAGAVTFSFYRGATGASAAGTEVIGTGVSVPANSYVDYYGALRLDIADFLVGLASANTSLVATIEGEIGLR